MALDLTPNVTPAYIGAIDPSGGKEYHIFKAPAACRVRVLKVYAVTATTRAANNTNNNVFTLNRIRAASATAIGLGTTDTDTTGYASLAADVPFEIKLTSDALSELAAGDVLQVVCTEGAGAQDLAEVTFVVEWAAGSGVGM